MMSIWKGQWKRRSSGSGGGSGSSSAIQQYTGNSVVTAKWKWKCSKRKECWGSKLMNGLKTGRGEKEG